MTSIPSRRLAVLVLVGALGLVACGGDDDPAAVTVALEPPTEGAAVAGGVPLSMTADGLRIEEAGEVHEGAGHFHVIADDGCVKPGEVVPRDADHVHFGKGQSEGTIYLAPGTHELCLQAADGAHLALDATDTVTVEVGITDRDEWCAVSGSLDELFSSAEVASDDFPAVQVAYENVRRVLAQLGDALDEVDAELRPDIADHMGDASTIATAFIEADDQDAAEAAIAAAFGPEGIQYETPGRAAVGTMCE